MDDDIDVIAEMNNFALWSRFGCDSHTRTRTHTQVEILQKMDINTHRKNRCHVVANQICFLDPYWETMDSPYDR